MSTDWDPSLYQDSHSFVWQYGRDLIDLLAPVDGERILDVGCGTGQLTAEIASSGADVVGVDRSPAMIEQARANFPAIRFEVQDARALPYEAEFDAVFSNAALHWVKDAEAAAASIARALKPGGRFVVELGGKGNVQAILDAVWDATNPPHVHPWYFPSVGEYASLLEACGLEVGYAVLFDRPTKLEGIKGLRTWLDMFGADLTEAVRADQREKFLAAVERHAAPRLLRDGVWHADYRRLRVRASRVLRLE
jgi:SAM-dependent methyltransferase